MNCRKNTPVENEFMDSEKIVTEEASGHQNVKAHSKANEPCSGITLRAKALRVISKYIPGEASAPVRVREPPAGPQKFEKDRRRGRFSENFGHITTWPAHVPKKWCAFSPPETIARRCPLDSSKLRPNEL